jgi:hypothetical protein
VTVVTGLLLFLLSPGDFSCLGPVDGAQTAERREKKNLRKFEGVAKKKGGRGKKLKFVL